jgi:DNA transposition AAA+ family ATPase
LDIGALRLLSYVYDLRRLGVGLIEGLRLYEILTEGSGLAGELEQLWSRVGICELLPGLTEYEARQMIQKTLGRIPEAASKQILRQTGNSIRRLTKLLDRLKELQEINDKQDIADLIPVAEEGLLALAR